MRIWTLRLKDGIAPDASKFAELLANGATDVVWVGDVNLTTTHSTDYTDPVKDVVYIDKDGDVASYEVGDFSLEENNEGGEA